MSRCNCMMLCRLWSTIIALSGGSGYAPVQQFTYSLANDYSLSAENKQHLEISRSLISAVVTGLNFSSNTLQDLNLPFFHKVCVSMFSLSSHLFHYDRTCGCSDISVPCY